MKTHLILAASALMVASQALAQPPAGLWDATVIVNDVAIPFRFELSGTAPNLRGAFFNGDDKVPSTGGHFESGTLLLNFDQYAAKLEASWKDGALSGEYTRSKRPYAFHAAPAAPSSAAVSAEKVPPIDGPWEFEATSSKGESAWRFVARQSGAQVSAAILRVDGDTGALQGTWRDGKFVLSHFDGARPLLLEVTPQADGTLALLLNGNQKYTAVRSAEARAKNVPAPTDPATHTSVKDLSEPFHFSFRDLAGNIVSDTDPRFRDKVVIVAIGGSWCPNCHDEAPFLEALYQKYRARGLEVVGLFFEEADQLQDPSRVRAFIKQYGIEYPILLAGQTSELHDKVPQAVQSGLLADHVHPRARRPRARRSRWIRRRGQRGVSRYPAKRRERAVGASVERNLAGGALNACEWVSLPVAPSGGPLDYQLLLAYYNPFPALSLPGRALIVSAGGKSSLYFRWNCQASA